MYARVTQLEIDPVRTDVKSALQLYKHDVVPSMEQQEGYAGVLVMVTPEGKGLIASLWTTEEAAEASAETGFYADVLARYVTLFKAPPGRERYEVVFADIRALVEG
jgi:hypothetical protein